MHIDTNWFYQIQQGKEKEPVYISTTNGKILPQGEWLYAQYLAKQFLEGKTNNRRQIEKTNTAGLHNCCDAATNCVLNNGTGAKVKDVSTFYHFTEAYKSINKLLPVHRVSFDRKDGISIYVETTQDRFAYAEDNKRAVFDQIFQWLHTWSFLDFLGKGKLVFEIIFTLLTFCTAIAGLYIFFITKSKKTKKDTVSKARTSHRITSVSIALFTLLFSFSGAFHAFSKLNPSERYNEAYTHWFQSKNISLNLTQIQKIVLKPITNIALIQINHQNYWQVYTKNESRTQNKPKDLMKGMVMAVPNAVYINCINDSILKNGEIIYANTLGSFFSQQPVGNIQSTTAVTKFEGEYGFANKRLPVWKIAFTSKHHERYYVETSSGTLAARIDDTDLWEDYSFSFLHKHHFMDFAGKSWRDFSTMFWAAAQIAMVIVGLILYFRLKKRPKGKHHVD